jgi:hypothetical protein
MSSDAIQADEAPASSQRMERRRTARINEQFPVKVRGKDAIGDRFDLETVLDNIGSKGLFVRLARSVAPGTELFVIVRLSLDTSVFAPRIAIYGEVLRAEPQRDGSCGVAVEFKRHRFL